MEQIFAFNYSKGQADLMFTDLDLQEQIYLNLKEFFINFTLDCLIMGFIVFKIIIKKKYLNSLDFNFIEANFNYYQVVITITVNFLTANSACLD